MKLSAYGPAFGVSIESDMIHATRAIANFIHIACSVPGADRRQSIPSRMPGSTTRCARKSSLNSTWDAYEGRTIVNAQG